MAVWGKKGKTRTQEIRGAVRYRRLVRRMRRFPWALAGILFLFSIGLGTAGILYHRSQVRLIRSVYEKELAAASNLKADEIFTWLKEREIPAATRALSLIVISLVSALILFAGGGLVMVWNRQRGRMEHRQLLAEVERLAMAQRFEFLSRYAHDVIILLDEKFSVVEANDRTGEVYGYSSQEIKALGLKDIQAPGAATQEDDQLALVRERDGHVYETMHRKKDGFVFPVEVSARVIEAGGSSFYQNIIRDISERKATEQELKRYREQLEEMIAGRTEELRMSNHQLRRVVEVRRLKESRILRQDRLLNAINRVLGETLSGDTDPDISRIGLKSAMDLTESTTGFIEELSAKGRADVLVMGPPGGEANVFSYSDDNARLKYLNIPSHLGRIMREGKSLVVNTLGCGSESSAKYPPDHPAVRSFLGVPLVRDKRVVGLIGLANKASGYSPEDKTDVEALALVLIEVMNRKRSEKTVRQLNAELSGHVAELTAANEELDAFSYSVAHDLRAPLRAVAGFSGVLGEEYGHLLDEEGKRHLAIIGGNVRIMSELIEKLLALSRLSRQPLACSKIDMGALVREIFLELNSLAGERNVSLSLSQTPTCRADKNLIRQVLFNLLSNAFKFTIPRKKAELKFWGEVGPAEVTYTLQDNGVGFDQLYAHKLFGVFQRLHSLREFEGTGVGLAIVQRIIRRHGGRVWAEGVVDRGAAFSFSLPRDLLAVGEDLEGEGDGREKNLGKDRRGRS